MRIATALTALTALLGSAPAEPAAQIAAGTEIELRLTGKFSSSSSKANDPVEAVVIAPVLLGDHVIIPAGAAVKGSLKQVQPPGPEHPRATVGLEFTALEIASRKTQISAQVVSVDNARESIDDKGQILGILGSETLSARMDEGIRRLTGTRLSGIATILAGAKNTFGVKEPDPQIEYGPGVELTIKLTDPLTVDGPGTPLSEYVAAVEPADELVELVNTQPFQTTAEQPPKPSDVTNLMFLGSEEQLKGAFNRAGWTSAAALNAQAKVETLRAIVENRGYDEAPVSVLLLDGQRPDLVFEKLNNTFAQRHHLRIWKRPSNFQGRPVWVCAATHDTGIEFSPQNRTFIHKIDPSIDRERAKVVADLLFTGLVKGLSLVARPNVPTEGQNATGDKLMSDAQMAVLLF
jgi:hypothetical protein